MEKARSYYWDNLKFALICLVVISHGFTRHVDASSYVAPLLVFVNSFHMPLFIFVAGVFHKNEKINKRVALLLAYTFLFKIVMFLKQYIMYKGMDFTLFTERSMPWYLLAIVSYALLTYVVRGINQWFVLACAVIAGCLAGYDAFVTGSEVISRVVVWFPFYYLGFIIGNQGMLQICKGIDKNSKKKYIAAFGFTIMVICAIICIWKRTSIYDWWYFVVPTTLYAKLPFTCGGTTRFIYYILVCFICIGFMSVIPQRKMWGISKWGERTLQVYMYHIIVRDVLEYYGIAKKICSSPTGIIMYIIFNILLVIVLSQRFFSWPTDMIRKVMFKK